LIEKWDASYLEEIQRLEAFFEEIRTLTLNLESSVGVNLDVIGRIVLLGRGAYDRYATDDEDYRAALQVRIRALRSQGKTKDFDEILTLLTALMGGTWETFDEPPAAFSIHLFDVDYDPNLVAAMFATAKGAGVGITITADVDPADEFFRFADGSDADDLTSQGWDDGKWTTPVYEV
jgi:hypothetical protein